MGSCSRNQDGEENATVGTDNSSEMEKEIAVVGDPTDDIMIDDIMVGGDNLIFSDDVLFTSLAELQCLSPITLPQNPSLSSSSSSSSTSSSPWAYIDVPGPAQEPHLPQQGQELHDQMVVPLTDAAADNILADFELWDTSNNPLDPSILFADLEAPQQQWVVDRTVAGDGDGGGDGNAGGNEMGKIFFEWLRSNRHAISMEELRSIRLKRSTIDCASASLGSGDKGRQELLRLILAWVQSNHLNKIKEHQIEAQDMPLVSVPQFCNNHHHLVQQQQQQVAGTPAYNPHQYQFPAFLDAAANPNSNPNLDYSKVPALVSTGNAASMNPSHPYYRSGSTSSIVVNGQPLSPSPDFCSFSPPPVQCPPLPGLGIPCEQPILQYTGGFGSQYPVCPMPPLTREALATKEARKKRMARQRRSSFLHQHKNQSHIQLGSSNALTRRETSNNVKNWAFWSSGQKRSLPTTGSSGALLPAKTSNMQQSVLQQRNGASSNKLQGTKKNVSFLFQKVLKQSDVGNLGRIVLPKKEAEIHLPELHSRDGMCIPMEDVGTSRVWNMKYRFWPNNRSRMYLLENTGDFIKSNGLQQGDSIAIYLDVKRNKYMIRGVKGRQPAEPKEVAEAGARPNGAKAHPAVRDLENNEASENGGGALPSMIMVDDV